MEYFQTGILIVIAIGLLFVAVRQLIPDWFNRLSRGRSHTARFPQHLNARVAEQITDANDRLAQAKAALGAAQSTLKDAESALGANAQAAQLAAREAAIQLARESVDRAQDLVDFEESQLAQLLRSQEPDHINLGIVLQYLIFATLAWFVLVRLLNGITSSPPAGTTPRSLITFLIAVVTVGIALILVLATIVSNSDDREKRFSQGKEVLTALLGVLGTIVGFYFGSAEDVAQGFVFDPIVIREAAGSDILTTQVHGGTAPYTYKTTFTPSSVTSPASVESTDGQISVTVPEGTTTYVISVRDVEGHTGSIANKYATPPKSKPESSPDTRR